MATECLRCARPMADQAYACALCATQAAQKLSEVAEVTQAARDVAHGLSSRPGGGSSGKPGSRLPLDLTATSKLDAIERELGTWLRHVGEERGTSTTTVLVPLPDEDPIVVIAERLMQHLEWFRHRAEIDEFLTDVDAAARVMRGLVRGPAEQRYLGPCGAPQIAIEPDVAAKYGIPPANAALGLAPCDGDVYGRAGGDKGTCRTCGASVDQGERRAWLDGEVRSHAYTAVEIADAYPIKANTIRQWLSRGLLTTHGELGGRPLMLLGEVLDLAAGDAARREEARATRARRTAARAEVDAA
jgi:hypothetical protein